VDKFTAMENLGIIGFGSFGQFMTKHLKPYFNICVYNRSDKRDAAKEYDVPYISLEEVASKENVIVCVPVQFMEEMLVKIAPYVKKDARIIDVSSVKVKPVELMKKHLPSHCEIIATHPLFGPQSGKDGIKGLNMVLCPGRKDTTHRLERFFRDELGLNVLIRTPEVHDIQMAYVQALTHFIGRAVNEMDIPDVEQKTPAYQYLLNIKRNLGGDSYDLFLTIEQENPYAKGVREQFLKELNKLHDAL
jgi:prephenate dehydrogenase